METGRRWGGVGATILCAMAAAAPGALEAQHGPGPGDWWSSAVSGSPLGGWRVEARVVLGGGDDRRGDPRHRRDDRRDGRWDEPAYEVVIVRDEDRARGRRATPRRGPAHCERGSGHPVFGWRWCDDRGYVRAPVWRSVDPGRLTFRRVSRDQGPFGARELERILGERAVDELHRSARWMGARQPLQGRWARTPDRRTRVLQVRAGGIPLAEFRDLDGDRRVDVVLVAGF